MFDGVVRSKRVLTQKARAEKNLMEPYESLPAELRANMTRKEYEDQEIRDSDEEREDAESGSSSSSSSGKKGSVDDGGLLPVVVFSFSKKKCEVRMNRCSSLCISALQCHYNVHDKSIANGMSCMNICINLKLNAFI